MKASAKETVSLPQVRSFPSAGAPAMLYAGPKGATNVCCGGIPAPVFGRHVVLHKQSSVSRHERRHGQCGTFMPVRGSISNSSGLTGGRSFGWN